MQQPIEELIRELDSVPTYGWSTKKIAAIHQTRSILSQLLDFKRTSEWSVSMLEDIAELLPTWLPDFDDEAEVAWRSH